MPRLVIALFLLFALPGYSQNAGGCSNFWLKADYPGLKLAIAEKAKAEALLKKTGLHDTLTAKAYATIGIYNEMVNEPANALIYYGKALARLKAYPAMQVYVHINRASAYDALTDYGKVMEVCRNALKNHKNSLTPATTALLYNAFSVAYLRMSDINNAADYALKGIALLEKNKSTCYLPLLKLSLANTYIQNNNYAFAITLFDEYFKNNPQAGGTKVHTIALVNYAECLIATDRYDKAKQELMAAIPDVENAGDAELTAVLYYRLGNLEDLRGNTTPSLSYYKKAHGLLEHKKSRFSTNIFSGYLNVLDKAGQYNEALRVAQLFKNTVSYRKGNPLERYNFEMAVAAIYKKTGRLAEANTALGEAVRLSDSLRQTRNGTLEQEVQARYQTKFQAEKNQLLQNKITTEERLMLMYILGSIAAIIVALLFLRSYRLRSRLAGEELKNLQAAALIKEQQHAYEQEMAQSQKLTLQEKEREVTAMALRLANYYDTINELIGKCGSGKYESVNDIKKDLQQLIGQKEYWKLFETRFNNMNPDFAENLKARYGKLTKNDIEFCTLLKLKLANKEIASLLQISHESVITKKYRIRKKMDINTDEEFESLLAIV